MHHVLQWWRFEQPAAQFLEIASQGRVLHAVFESFLEIILENVREAAILDERAPFVAFTAIEEIDGRGDGRAFAGADLPVFLKRGREKVPIRRPVVPEKWAELRHRSVFVAGAEQQFRGT